MNKLKTVLDDMYQERTLVFGHRGASAYAPMNTIEAFELAAELGADGVELDVHRSADGHAVIVHDFTVDRTTDGSGEVTQMTLAQLKALDAGSWKDPKFAGAKIPTLDEVFEAVGQRLYVNVEIKARERHLFRTDGVEQVVADTIARHNMKARVIVSSFQPMSLRRFRKIMPDVPVGYLTAPGMPFFVNWFAFGLKYEAYHPQHISITPQMVAEMHGRGRRINTWTVNEPEDARRLRDMGVDLLISDKPDVIRDALVI